MMERLTKKEKYGIDIICENCPYHGICADTSDCLNVVSEKLFAYEDTGLTPEQIKAQQWISVKDGLPEKTGSYLVFYHEWSNGEYLPKYDDYRVRVMRFLNNGSWRLPVCLDRKCEEYVNREITHWMPLPEPPKEAQK